MKTDYLLFEFRFVVLWQNKSSFLQFGDLDRPVTTLVYHNNLGKLGDYLQKMTGIGVLQPDEGWEAFLREHEVGRIKRYPAYVSMSGGDEAYNPNGQVQIIVLHSKHGRDIRRYNEVEQKILYPRGSLFNVRSIERKEDGTYEILLTEASDD